MRTLPAKATLFTDTPVVPATLALSTQASDNLLTEEPETGFEILPTAALTASALQQALGSTLTFTPMSIQPGATQTAVLSAGTVINTRPPVNTATPVGFTPTPTGLLAPTVTLTPPRIPRGLPGIWQQEFTGWWMQFNTDGVFRVADSLVNLRSSAPNDIGEYQINVVQVTLTSRSASIECSRQNGRYSFTINNQGLVQFALQQDACDTRPGWMTQYPWRQFSDNPTALFIADAPSEAHFKRIELAEVGDATLDITGMDWYQDEINDKLILLPRRPELVTSNQDGALLAINRQDLKDYLSGNRLVVQPQLLYLSAAGVAQAIPGFTGYEALVILEERVYLIARGEAGGAIRSYLVSGILNPEQGVLTLSSDSLSEIGPQGVANQFGYRALLFQGNAALAAFCEGNSSLLNPSPVAFRFATSLTPLGAQAIPNLEYRLTDTTAVDSQGRFWVMNRFNPQDGEALPATDPVNDLYGQGATHRLLPWVERLVEYQQVNGSFQFSGRNPIQLELAVRGPRDWQAIARLDELGFLVAGSDDGQVLFGFVAIL